MIILDCAQGSVPWVEARIGIPTASEYSKILTPKTMRPSASSQGYINKLIAEWALNTSLDDFSSPWMERGAELEESARAYYELQHSVDTRRVGFVYMDERRLTGCSPDSFVGDDGLLEIKCPSAAVHVGHLLGNLADEHRAQVQGCMWVTGRSFVDLLSYHPTLPPARDRVERDETFIAALSVAVDDFIARLKKAREFMIERGYVRPRGMEGQAA